jgi:AAA+ superfamily predicted ATPase
MNLNKTLRDYFLSTHPLLYLTTHEEQQVVAAAEWLYEQHGVNIFFWKANKGVFSPTTSKGERMVKQNVAEAIVESAYIKGMTNSLVLPQAAPNDETPADVRELRVIAPLRGGSGDLMDGPDPSDPDVALSFMDHLFKVTGELSKKHGLQYRGGQQAHCIPNVLLLCFDMHRPMENHDAAFVRTIKDMEIKNKSSQNCMTVVGVQKKISPELERHFVYVDNPLPAQEDLKRVAVNIFKNNKIDYDSVSVTAISASGMGMTTSQFENAISLSYIRNERQRVLPADISAQRHRIINDCKTLSVLHDRVKGADYGGHRRLLSDMELIKAAFTKEGEKFGLRKNRPVLLVGAPGVGKTLAGGYLAELLQCEYIRCDISSAKGSLVGQTEETFRNDIKVLEALGMAVVLFDEVEKSLGNAHEAKDSGATGGILDELLFKLEKGIGDVIPIFTSNRPWLLPAEFLRRVTIYHLGLPSKDDLEVIHEIQCRAQDLDPKEFPLKELAAKSETFSGADVRKVWSRSKDLGFLDGAVKSHHVFEALEGTTSSYSTSKEDIQRMISWADGRAIDSCNNDRSSTKIRKQPFIVDDIDTSHKAPVL